MDAKKYFFLLLFGINLFFFSVYAENYIYISLTKEQGELPADFYIEDQEGRKTGFDNTLKRFYNEIPNGVYHQEELSDDLDSLWFKEFYIFETYNAYTSNYIITVNCREETPYEICIEAGRDGDTTLFRVTYQDTIKPDEKKMYKLVYLTDPSIPLRVEEVEFLSPITIIDQMIAYIKKAFSQSQISSQGIATSLISKLEVAKQALEKEKPKQAVNALNAFLNELEAQHEKHITDEVYLYLKEKVEALIRQIGSSG